MVLKKSSFFLPINPGKLRTCIGVREWSRAFFDRLSSTSDISTSVTPDSFFLWFRILPEIHYQFGLDICGRRLQIPIIDSGDVLVLLDRPTPRKIFHPDLFPLVYVQRAGLSDLQDSEHLGGHRAPLVRIIAEARNRPRMIVVFDENTVEPLHISENGGTEVH